MSDKDFGSEGNFDGDSEMEDNVEIVDEDMSDPGDEQGDGFKNKRGYKKNTEKITAKFLTKYERARILGTRAL